MIDSYYHNRLVRAEIIKNRWKVAIASTVLGLVALGAVWFLQEVFNG